MKLIELGIPFAAMTHDDKITLLEEIRLRRTPIVKQVRVKSIKPKGVKVRKPRSIEEALAYMNEQIERLSNGNDNNGR